MARCAIRIWQNHQRKSIQEWPGADEQERMKRRKGIADKKDLGWRTNKKRRKLFFEVVLLCAGKFHQTKGTEDSCWLGRVHIVQVGAFNGTRLGSTKIRYKWTADPRPPAFNLSKLAGFGT